jgi:Mg2+ and Co2+ transporter CorA
MATTALGLALQISASTAGLQQEVQQVNKRLDSMVEQSEKTAKGMKVLSTIAIGRALIDSAKALAGALSSAASSAKALFDDSRSAIDAIGKLSTQTGVAVETIQSYSRAAGLSGVSIEEMTKALQKMQVSLGKIDEDAKTDPFRDLGLSAQKLRESGAQESFEAIADAIAGLATDAEKAAAANEIFGRSGVVLLPLLNQGAEALARQREEAEQLGILTDEQVRGVESMNDAFSDVGTALQGIINQVTAELAEPIETITRQVIEMIKQIGVENIAATIATTLLDFGETFLNALEFFVSFIAQFIEVIKDLLSSLGYDIYTEEEKRMKQLEQRDIAQQRAENMSGRSRLSASRRLEQLGGRLSPQELQELREFQARQADPTRMVADFFGAAKEGIDAARKSIAGTPELAQSQVDATVGVKQALEDGNNQVVEVLEEIRDGQETPLPVAL